MQLSDVDIKKGLKSGDVIIKNFDPERLQPARYDVLLGHDFLVFDRHQLSAIDPREDVKKYMKPVTIDSENDYFVLQPGEFALGVTNDFIGVSNKLSCEVMGKSSLARLGLIIHTTAGFIDPGNQLNITLEFVNTNKVPIKLYPKMKIAQVAFFQLSSPCEKCYGHKSLNSKYYRATTVQASEMHKNYNKEND